MTIVSWIFEAAVVGPGVRLMMRGRIGVACFVSVLLAIAADHVLADATAKDHGVTVAGSVLASAAGAVLDTDLVKGGGTDDTAALQAVLDRAAQGQPVHLVIDGAALVSGLNVYANTTLECLAGGGLFLKDK